MVVKVPSLLLLKAHFPSVLIATSCPRPFPFSFPPNIYSFIHIHILSHVFVECLSWALVHSSKCSSLLSFKVPFFILRLHGSWVIWINHLKGRRGKYLAWQNAVKASNKGFLLIILFSDLVKNFPSLLSAHFFFFFKSLWVYLTAKAGYWLTSAIFAHLSVLQSPWERLTVLC